MAAEVEKLKQQPGGDVQVIGCGEVAQTLIQNGLVDEYALMINPIVVGSGKRLFRRPSGPSGSSSSTRRTRARVC